MGPTGKVDYLQGSVELVWLAGSAQVDFGQAEALIDRVRQMLHVLVVTFTYSNMSLVQAYRGVTQAG